MYYSAILSQASDLISARNVVRGAGTFISYDACHIMNHSKNTTPTSRDLVNANSNYKVCLYLIKVQT